MTTPDPHNPAHPDAKAHSEGGMDYLVTRQRKLVTVYLPLAVFSFVL
ncbi:MAG: carbohydrate ABC transporter permease, partial [Betaproteobacteria bacterium]|nr:carbohydrate ABC transporter permease [Betaproteobacteria bacterium]